MKVVEKVKIGNDVTQDYKFPSVPKYKLNAKWLANNHYYISGYWPQHKLFPQELELNLHPPEDDRYFDEDPVVIPMGHTVFTDLTGEEEIVWLTQKQLERSIRWEMGEACAEFTKDFFPAAVAITLKAQEVAKKIVTAEKKKRAAAQKKKKVAKKSTRKKVTKKRKR